VKKILKNHYFRRIRGSEAPRHKKLIKWWCSFSYDCVGQSKWN